MRQANFLLQNKIDGHRACPLFLLEKTRMKTKKCLPNSGQSGWSGSKGKDFGKSLSVEAKLFFLKKLPWFRK